MLNNANGPCTGATRFGCCGSTTSIPVGMSNSISIRSPLRHTLSTVANRPGSMSFPRRLPFTEMVVPGPAHAGIRTQTGNCAGFSVAISISVDGRCGYPVRCVSVMRSEPRVQRTRLGTNRFT